MNILTGLTVLLVCQLIGDVLARLSGLPVPGPVLGMVLLLVCLLVRGQVPPGLDTVTTTVLSHLSLLFVPAGVGIVVVLPLVVQQWLPLTVAIIGSTLLAIAVGGVVAERLLRRIEGRIASRSEGNTPHG